MNCPCPEAKTETSEVFDYADLLAVDTEDRAKQARRSTGSMVKMRRGITMDTGAHHNVMPRRMVGKKKIRPSPGSRIGMKYVGAGGERIPNEGEVDFPFRTAEGHKQNVVFQIAEVNKALCAVSYLVDRHNQVIFDKDEETGMDVSRMINKKTGKVIEMTRERNVWTIDAYIDEDTDEAVDFVRRG